MEAIFSIDGSTLLRTLTMGVLAYATLLVFLRATGKRTLSKLNAFDLVVTVALGSTLATLFLNKDISWAQGALALGLLVGLQFAITWTSVRLNWVRNVVTGEPSLLVHRGQFLADLMHRERVTPEEILAAVRSAGYVSLDRIEAVVLETDGSFSVIGSAPGEDRSTLAAVKSRAFEDTGRDAAEPPSASAIVARDIQASESRSAMQTKICESCQQSRPVSEFRRTGQTDEETSAWCMQCEERESGRGSKRPPTAGEEVIRLPPD